MAIDDIEVARRLVALRIRDAELGQLAEAKADEHRSHLEHVDSPFVFPQDPPFEDFYPSFIYVDPHLNVKSNLKSATVVEIGDYVVFIPRHCVVSSTLSEQMALVGDADFAYGDSFHFDPTDPSQFTHQLRPGWSPERLRGHCYVGDVVIATKKVVRRAGGKKRLAKLSSHARVLRLSEKAQRPHHLEILLYGTEIDRRMPELDADAVKKHCSRRKIKADVSLAENKAAITVNRRRKHQPSICVIMPTRGTSAEVFGHRVVMAAHAVEKLRERSTYKNFEFLVVADSVTPQSAIDAITSSSRGNARFIQYDKPFNFAEKINLAAVQTDAEYLLFVNDDTEIITPEIVEVMLSYFEDESVGMVGPMLKYEDGTIQSAGHLMNPYPVDLYRGHEINGREAFGLLNVAREVSSVIAAFSLTPRKLFLEAGGMCMQFPSDYNDVDYAFKLDLLGYRTIFTPFAECFHFESKTRVPGEVATYVELLGRRWQHKVDHDSFGNSYLQKYVPMWKSNHDSPWSTREAMGAGTVAP